ncbi:MAG: methyltransferase domain-containing protein [Gammaproteobacteria bacterium]|nr:methyltransferase domain-containing protein [Gammaproteobacteria bacterium]
MHSKHALKNHFNRAAETYDASSVIQKAAGHCLVNKIKQHVINAPHIIDLGCGSADFTEHLAAFMTYDKFYAIDIAEKLLEKAKSRLRYVPIQFFLADYDCFHFPLLAFDLIVSNMALQWSIDFPAILQRIHLHLKSQGIVAFSLPLQETFQELPIQCRNGLPTVNHILNQLRAANLIVIDYATDKRLLQFDTWVAALKHIKATGANYIVHKKDKSLSRTFPFEKTATENPKLTYQLGYFIAQRST